MRGAQRFFWPLVAAAVTVYLTMILWSLPKLARMAGGVVPYDLRPLGYTRAGAEALVLALGRDGIQFYLGVQQALDLAYPALFAATLVLAFHRLAPRERALALSTLAIAGMIFDYAENLLVRVTLEAGLEKLATAPVELASFFTIAKSAATTAALLALSLLVVTAGWRRLKTARHLARD